MVVQRGSEKVEFRLYLPHANVVEVVGSFTQWQEAAVAMQRVEDGWWSARVSVPRGEHRFSYLVDGRYWMPDYAANGIEHNHNGQWVSRLEVEAAEDASAPPRDARVGAAAPGRSAEPVVRATSRALGAWLGGGVGAAGR